jgi:hypothetical protein
MKGQQDGTSGASVAYYSIDQRSKDQGPPVGDPLDKGNEGSPPRSRKQTQIFLQENPTRALRLDNKRKMLASQASKKKKELLK